MQVRLLAHNLNEILSNTMKLQQYEDVSSSTHGTYHMRLLWLTLYFVSLHT